MRVDPAEGCSEIVNDVAGKIAVIDEGSCEFSTQAQHAQNAGAVAAIILSHESSPPTILSCSEETCADITIPTFMLANDQVAIFQAALDGNPDELYNLGCPANFQPSGIYQALEIIFVRTLSLVTSI